MAARVSPIFKAPRFAQKGASFLIDDNLYRLLKKNPLETRKFINEVDHGAKRGLVIVANSVKRQMQMMNAVATGFMRKTITYEYEAGAKKKGVILKYVLGTKAWYDILVHEGLGLHGGQRTIPAKYRPSEMQKSIVEPSPAVRMSKEFKEKYWKPSPKVPRPFLVKGVKAARSSLMKETNVGIRKAFKTLAVRGGSIPKHDVRTALGGGVF